MHIQPSLRHLAVAIVAVIAAACGGASTSSSGTVCDLLCQIKQKGVIKVGIGVDPPYTDQNPDGSFYGLIPSYDAALAKVLGVKLQLVPTGWATIVAGLQSGRYDMIGASISETPERALAIRFTDPYSQDGFNWYVSKDNPKQLKTQDDLNNSKVTITFSTNTAQDSISRNLFPKAQFRAIPNASYAQLVQELQSNHSDAMAGGSYLRVALETKFSWITAIPDNDVGVQPTPVGLAVRYGPDSDALLTALNTFVKNTLADGTYQKLRTQWFAPQYVLTGD